MVNLLEVTGIIRRVVCFYDPTLIICMKLTCSRYVQNRDSGWSVSFPHLSSLHTADSNPQVGDQPIPQREARAKVAGA